LANRRKKTRQGRRFQNPGAKGISDGHIAGACSAEQAGHTQSRVRPQHGWITVLIVEAAKQHVHSLQPFERF
jgi:hypothetical protein